MHDFDFVLFIDFVRVDLSYALLRIKFISFQSASNIIVESQVEEFYKIGKKQLISIHI
jgi:hypothetical protein